MAQAAKAAQQEAKRREREEQRVRNECHAVLLKLVRRVEGDAEREAADDLLVRTIAIQSQ